MYFYDFIQGLIIGLSLIIAIGPQNLFIIKQGLKKNYIFMVCLICSFSDSLLIIIGIYLSSYIAQISPFYLLILKTIGGIWLIIYGVLKIKNSFNKKYKKYKENIIIKKNVLLTTLFITYVNPHVYLDTVVLIGAISQNFTNKISFGLGAILASFLFFYFLGYFSKYIGEYIQNKKTWYLIGNIFGLLMISYGLFFIFDIS